MNWIYQRYATDIRQITDTRLDRNLSNIERRMDGDIDDLIEELSNEDEAERLSRLEEEDAS